MKAERHLIAFMFRRSVEERGGGAYNRYLFDLFKEVYGARVVNDDIPIITRAEQKSILWDTLKLSLTILRHRPRLCVFDISNAVRSLVPFLLSRVFGSVLMVAQGVRIEFRYESSRAMRFVRWCENLMIKRSDIILANSEYMRNTLLSLGAKPESLVVVKPGVKKSVTEEFPKRLDSFSELRILYAGATELQKGTVYLIEAFRSLNDKRLHLDIVGVFDRENDYCRNIQRLISSDPNSENIAQHGFASRAELDRLFREAALFVIPSLGEGFGMAPIEAMSYGLPVVATRVGELQHNIEDHVNGILVEPANSEQIADAIRLLLSDDDLYAEISKNNIEKSRQFYDFDGFKKSLKENLIPLVDRAINNRS